MRLGVRFRAQLGSVTVILAVARCAWYMNVFRFMIKVVPITPCTSVTQRHVTLTLGFNRL